MLTDVTKQQADKEKALNEFRFTDSRGRVYSPRVTARVIKVFEDTTGIGLFTAVVDALGGEAQFAGSETEKPAPKRSIFALSKAMFGNMGNVIRLLFESSREYDGVALSAGAMGVEKRKSEDGQTIEHRVSVPFDDFAQCIGQKQIVSALQVAMAALLDFFPDMDSVSGTGEGGGTAGRPTESFFGGMSSSAPESPASNPGTTASAS